MIAIGKKHHKNDKDGYISTREFKKIFRKNGWNYLYSKGDHHYYGKNGIKEQISEGMNIKVGRRLIKTHNLTV